MLLEIESNDIYDEIMVASECFDNELGYSTYSVVFSNDSCGIKTEFRRDEADNPFEISIDINGDNHYITESDCKSFFDRYGGNRGFTLYLKDGAPFNGESFSIEKKVPFFGTSNDYRLIKGNAVYTNQKLQHCLNETLNELYLEEKDEDLIQTNSSLPELNIVTTKFIEWRYNSPMKTELEAVSNSSCISISNQSFRLKLALSKKNSDESRKEVEDLLSELNELGADFSGDWELTVK